MRNYYNYGRGNYFHRFDTALDSETEQHQKQRLLADKINSYADIQELRLLLVQGAQADGVVTLGLRPLHYAVYRQYFEAAKLLIVRGAKVDAVDDIGYSALHLCAEKGSFRMLKLLLEHLVNRNKCSFFESKDEAYPIRDGADEPLRLAIWQNHFECAKLLLEEGADPNVKYFDGPQISLIDPKQLPFIRLLLDHGANVNVFNRKGFTPLMCSCERGAETFRTTQLLIERGADVNAVNTKSNYLMSVLHCAVGSGDLPTIRLLLENGAKVNIEVPETERRLGTSQPPVLHFAIMSGNVEIVELFLKYGADIHASGTVYGNALHLAACHRIGGENQVELVALLLRNGGDPNSICLNSNGALLRSPTVEFFRRLYKFEMESRPGDVQWVDVVKLLFANGAHFDLNCDSIEVESMNVMAELRRPAYAEVLGSYVSQVARSIGNVEAMNENSLYLTAEQLKYLSNNPRSLRECCRNFLRSHMLVNESSVCRLPLPNFAKNYLLGHSDLP